jgi:phage RecT family recombinase
MEQATIKTPKKTTAIAPKAPQAVAKKQGTVVDYLNNDKFKEQLAAALPKFLDTDHFIRSAITEFRLNPALAECSVPSVLGYFMQAAACGLEPASMLGQCYPVPFNNKKTGQKETTFIIGFRGMLSIARRSGEIASVIAECVYEKDEFAIEYGMEPKLVHKPYIDGDPGAFRGAYVVVRFKGEGIEPVVKYMSKAEIDKHRARSKSSSYGPWVTDYPEMAKKGLALDTPIPTPYGWKTMGELEVGDQVYDMDGAITEVVAVSDVKHLPCYEVTYSNGEKIICDNEHRWYTEFGGNAARNVRERGWNVHTIEEMYEAKNDGRAVTVPIAKPVSGIYENNLPIDPWLLGYWLGDGSSAGAYISCHEEWAQEVADYINDKTKYTVETITPDTRGSKACQINVKDGFKVDLREAGLLENKHIPNAYMTAGMAQRAALLQGLMDSDGCIDKERGRAKFCSTNKALADAVFELASSLGEVCNRHETDGIGFGKPVHAYWVEWQPSVFPPVTLKHHVDKLKERKVAQYLSIKSIVPVESVPTRCIAVASDTKSYLCGKGYYVTHNTVFRSVFKWLPISIEQIQATTTDGAVSRYNANAKTDDIEDLVEVEFVAAEDDSRVTAEEAVEQFAGGDDKQEG